MSTLNKIRTAEKDLETLVKSTARKEFVRNAVPWGILNVAYAAATLYFDSPAVQAATFICSLPFGVRMVREGLNVIHPKKSKTGFDLLRENEALIFLENYVLNYSDSLAHSIGKEYFESTANTFGEIAQELEENYQEVTSSLQELKQATLQEGQETQEYQREFGKKQIAAVDIITSILVGITNFPQFFFYGKPLTERGIIQDSLFDVQYDSKKMAVQQAILEYGHAFLKELKDIPEEAQPALRQCLLQSERCLEYVERIQERLQEYKEFIEKEGKNK